MSTTNKMVCVLGRTCSGKDSLITKAIESANLELNSLISTEKISYELIVSFTTRPKRESEIDGREHLFITEDDYYNFYSNKKILAYTEINGYRYFTLEEQIDHISKKGNIPVYIIDPKGLWNLNGNRKDLDLYNIYINASREERLSRWIKRTNVGIANGNVIREFNKRDSNEDEQFKDFESKLFESNYRYGVDLVLFNEDKDKLKLSLNTLRYVLTQFALK